MTKELVEQQLRKTLEAELAGRVDRYMKSRVHPIIPDGFFSAASAECRKLFVDGNFYGCITLCQSVAEGLAKFIAEKNGMDASGKHRERINALQRTAYRLSFQAKLMPPFAKSSVALVKIGMTFII